MNTVEMFDITDADDRVIGQMPRPEVHARGLMHRAVHVFVFNTHGDLLLQKRSATKDEFPRCYTSSASGHLSAGEDYDECAPREMQEEIGLSPSIERLEKFPASPEMANEHTVLYRAVTDDEPIFDPDEVESGAYFRLDEISAMVEQRPEEFAPPFCVLFEWYLNNQHGERGA